MLFAAFVVAAVTLLGCAPQAEAGRWRPDLEAARAYAAERVGTISFAVRTPHRLYRSDAYRAFGSASVVKAMLMVAYLGASSVGVPVDGALKGAGWAEIVLAAVAFYIVLAELANETLGRQVFPLFPLARTAVQPA